MGIRRNKTILEQAADYVDAVVEATSEKAGPAISDAVDKAGPIWEGAKDKAGPLWDDAMDKAGPLWEDAKDKARPALADAKDRATPLLAAGVAAAAAQATNVADFANEKADELKGETKKKHRLRTLLLLTGIGAALVFVARKLASGGSQDNWQSAYTPPPPPSGKSTDTPIFDAATAASDEPAGADEGGAGPGEALADATDEVHPVTTPDEPADVVELAPDEESAEKGS